MRSGRLRLLPLLALAALLLVRCGWPPARSAPVLSSPAAAQLRPSMLITVPPSTPIDGMAIGDGLFAWSEDGTRSTTPAIHLYDLRTHRSRVLSPTQHRGRSFAIGNLRVNSHWLAWVEIYTVSGSSWAMHALNLRSGEQLLVDSTLHEHFPRYPSLSLSDANISLGGDTLAWTARRYMDGARVHSTVMAEDLATQKRTVVADLYEDGKSGFFMWPATNGRYVAWVHALAATQETDRVDLYDLRAHRTVALPHHASTSQPAMDGDYQGGDYLAWKQGSDFGLGQGVVLYNLRNGSSRFLPGASAGLPQLGAGLLGYHSQEKGWIYLYDLRSREHFILKEKQSVLPSGEVFVGLHLGGDDIALSGFFVNKYYAQFGLFHLSPAHPFYDLYH